jgi:serine protease inhibitor
MRTKSHLLIAALGALFLPGCNQVIEPRREAPPRLDISQQIFEGYTAFGFDAFHRLAREEPDSNLVLSPSSLAFALAMTYNGADGETASEMAEVLGVSGASLEVFNDSNAAWLAALREPDEGVQLAIANSMWIRDRFPVEADFVDRNQRHFDAAVERLDFDDPAAVDAINAWVAERTNDRIKEIIQEIDPLDMLFLINAVYFLGEWTVPFEEDGTSPGRFIRRDGTDVPIPMMSRSDTIDYLSGDGYQAVRLPYGETERFGMILLLPDQESTLEALYRDLDFARWRTLLTALEPTYVELHVPRFRVEWEKTLNEDLTALGMETAFLPNRADFSRINPDPRYDDLHVSEVLQKTFLQVNEKGTEAAAVTSVRMGVTSMPSYPVLHFDRPFFLAIHDRATDTILFMGQITDPQDPDWQAP